MGNDGGLRGDGWDGAKLDCFKGPDVSYGLVRIYMAVSRHARSTGDGITSWFEAADGERVRISIFLAEPACDTIANRFISMPLPQSHLYFEPLCSHELKTIKPLCAQGVAANFLKRAPRAAALVRASSFFLPLRGNR